MYRIIYKLTNINVCVNDLWSQVIVGLYVVCVTVTGVRRLPPVIMSQCYFTPDAWHKDTPSSSIMTMSTATHSISLQSATNSALSPCRQNHTANFGPGILKSVSHIIDSNMSMGVSVSAVLERIKTVHASYDLRFRPETHVQGEFHSHISHILFLINRAILLGILKGWH